MFTMLARSATLQNDSRAPHGNVCLHLSHALHLYGMMIGPLVGSLIATFVNPSRTPCFFTW